MLTPINLALYYLFLQEVFYVFVLLFEFFDSPNHRSILIVFLSRISALFVTYHNSSIPFIFFFDRVILAFQFNMLHFLFCFRLPSNFLSDLVQFFRSSDKNRYPQKRKATFSRDYAYFIIYI